jgi:hypothetical protein
MIYILGYFMSNFQKTGWGWSPDFEARSDEIGAPLRPSVLAYW